MANSVVVQSDGKIVAAGSASPLDLALARYNYDGSLDSVFNRNVDLSFYVGSTLFYSIVSQSDKKTIAVGSTWNGHDYDFAMVRYNTNGSLDSTFSDDGVQITDFGADDAAFTVAVQKDGKIVVSGNYVLARYNSDGSLDKSFSGDGKRITEISVSCLSLQSDGKIVVAGSNKDNGFPAVARYNADGDIDNTFNNTGKRIFIVGASDKGAVVSAPIQTNEKIVVAVITGNNGPYSGSIFLFRLNINGSLDSSYGKKGEVYFDGGHYASSCKMTLQNNDKAVIAGSYDSSGFGSISLGRFNTDGSVDSSFNGIRNLEEESSYYVSSINLQNNGKIVVTGSALFRYNTNGSLDSTFNGSGIQTLGFYVVGSTISGDKLYVAGGGVHGDVARYSLDKNTISPTVNLTSPADNAKYLAPAAHIKLSATASDSDGTITKVEFYKDSTLLNTQYVILYGYVWRKVPLGNYTITAKAYDNSGNVTTSAPVHISVVANKPPIVSIVTPVNNQTYAAPAYIHFEAAASDSDGSITKVEFYNGTTLLRTELKSPYTYVWKNVPAGTYTITAVATDNFGAQTISAAIKVKVVNAAIVAGKHSLENEKTALNDAFGLRLSPNPASNIVNVSTSGLQPNKPATLSIISISGIVLKTMRISNVITQLNVSTLADGMYTVKIISEDKVLYRQLMKL